MARTVVSSIYSPKGKQSKPHRQGFIRQAITACRKGLSCQLLRTTTQAVVAIAWSR
jgi:hypothetical protein